MQDQSILHLARLGAERSRDGAIPLRYVNVDGKAYVLFSNASPPEWVGWATTSPWVQWRILDRTFAGTAQIVEDSAELRGEILGRYRKEFGAEGVARWFPGEVGCVALSTSQSPISYYEQVEALFDWAAPEYDRTVLNDPLNVRLRRVSAGLLSKLFRPGSRVLEIGCGTGLETIPLAQSGVTVVALDIASGMLHELNRKAREASLGDRIETRQGSAGDLDKVLADFEPGSFDGAFSHFGALNCEPRLDRIPAVLHRLIKPRCRISLGVLNRTSLAEIVGYTAARKPRRAMARLAPRLALGNSSFGVVAFPHGPGAMQRIFAPFFTEEELLGVSVLVPPASLGGRLTRHPGLLTLLESADRAVAGRPLFRCLGDYFLMRLVRR